MSCLNFPLAPKRQVKLTAAVAALVVVVFLAFFVSSCEARRSRARGRVSGSTKPSSPAAPCKVGVDAASMKLHGSDPTNQKKDLSSSMDGHMVRGDAKAEERVTMASPACKLAFYQLTVKQQL
ncbi:hypothetical protein E2562_013083 [Oryza meyeriana var. granulata]|uniref:Uncharacterized protein n=1 Tax=Oryza meyeriana var. granulata TaxID=110450 RepID=A0A6G1DKE2_9ORYZ|nr:hypothetical protein E2562_013083 [Oryza meyeriana var. granulata]